MVRREIEMIQRIDGDDPEIGGSSPDHLHLSPGDGNGPEIDGDDPERDRDDPGNRWIWSVDTWRWFGERSR